MLMCLLFALGGFALGLAAGTALHLLAGRRRKEDKPVHINLGICIKLAIWCIQNEAELRGNRNDINRFIFHASIYNACKYYSPVLLNLYGGNFYIIFFICEQNVIQRKKMELFKRHWNICFINLFYFFSWPYNK